MGQKLSRHNFRKLAYNNPNDIGHAGATAG